MQFKPFQKVLTRDSATDNWFVDFFGEYGDIGFRYRTVMHPYGCDYCIAYEGNEDYLGTNKDAHLYTNKMEDGDGHA